MLWTIFLVLLVLWLQTGNLKRTGFFVPAGMPGHPGPHRISHASAVAG